MHPEDVVAASLHDLEHGVVMALPGARAEPRLLAVPAAQGEVQELTRVVELPTRYAEP
jgi:hypothetical protein